MHKISEIWYPDTNFNRAFLLGRMLEYLSTINFCFDNVMLDFYCNKKIFANVRLMQKKQTCLSMNRITFCFLVYGLKWNQNFFIHLNLDLLLNYLHNITISTYMDLIFIESYFELITIFRMVRIFWKKETYLNQKWIAMKKTKILKSAVYKKKLSERTISCCN